MTKLRTGGCRCAAVRVEATGPPKFVGNCHCRACRHASGAAFSTFVGYLDEQVRWIGAERTRYESSPGVFRSFCTICGSPLSYQGQEWAGETHLFIGCLDDPADLTPTGDVFTDEKLHWAPLVSNKAK